MKQEVSAIKITKYNNPVILFQKLMAIENQLSCMANIWTERI